MFSHFHKLITLKLPEGFMMQSPELAVYKSVKTASTDYQTKRKQFTVSILVQTLHL